MRRILLTTAFACTSMLMAMPEKADAQVFYRRPWVRPRVFFAPRPWIAPVVAPPIVVQPPPVYYYPPPYYAPPPQVYVQPVPQQPVYPQPVYPQSVYPQPAPQVYTQPLPAPPVYAQPAPPPIAAPPPPVYAPPPPPPIAYRPPMLSQWQTKFGIGARFTAAINTDAFASFSQLGFGGELLFRVHRHLVLELGADYQKRMDDGFARYDVPATLGLRVHIGAPDWVVSPYFVFAGGGVYANLDYLHSHDIGWFLNGQLGGGLEIRIGKHLALTADLRGDARHRLNQPDAATANTISINGKPFVPLQDSYGLLGRLGAAVYF